MCINMKYFLVVVFLLLLNNCTISYPDGIIAEYTFNGNLNDYKRAEVAVHHGEIAFAKNKNKIGLKLTKSHEPNYLELPNIHLNNSEFTITLSILIDSFNHNNSIFFYGDDDDTWETSGLWLYTEQQKLAVFVENQFLTKENFNPKAKLNNSFITSENLDANKAYYITLTYKDTELKLFVNAKEYAVYHNVKPFSTKKRKALIGIANNPKTGRKFQYEGVVDNLKIYNKCITEEQIQMLYNLNK